MTVTNRPPEEEAGEQQVAPSSTVDARAPVATASERVSVTPGVAEAPAPVPSPRGTSVAKRTVLDRLVDFFWLRSRERAARARRALGSPRTLELERRAALALDLGGRAFEPAKALPRGPADALACELFRQSVYWSLAAQVETATPEAPDARSRLAESDFAALWKRADRDWLVNVSGSESAADALFGELDGANFRDLAELDPAEQARRARDWKLLAESLVHSLDASNRELERIWTSRILRLVTAIAVVAIIAVAGKASIDRWLWRVDLARTSTWVASSKYPDGGCASPAQTCGDASKYYFFSTNEEDTPWIEFDLGQVRTVSAVRVTNRQDCCADRAAPLHVEVSRDRRTWKEVAQRGTEFDVWTARFPRESARFVKFRLSKRTNLHFVRVQIAP